MSRLSSPIPSIEAILSTDLACQIALQQYLDEQKFVTRRVMQGIWDKFLDSRYGSAWRNGDAPLVPPEPNDILDPPVPDTVLKPLRDVTCIGCGTTFPNKSFATLCPDCLQKPYQEPKMAPSHVLTPIAPPSQSDLFDLIAQGLQDRLKPQSAVLDEERVKALIDSALKEQALRSTHKIIVKKGDEILRKFDSDLPLPRWFERAYKLAKARLNVLLVGPAGCGKTVTADLLAKALDLPLTTISLSSGVSEGVIQGWLHPSKAGLLFEYNRSRFVKAYTEGGVVLLDELDAADPNMLMILNAALANGRWEIPLRGEDAEPLIKSKNFWCMAAANTKGHGADRVYAARNQLDGATLSRFKTGRIAVDYDEAMEKLAYDKATVAFGQRLRARCRAQKGWTWDVSTRDIADACKAQEELSLEESWWGFFEDWKEEDLPKVGAVRNRNRMSITLE